MTDQLGQEGGVQVLGDAGHWITVITGVTTKVIIPGQMEHVTDEGCPGLWLGGGGLETVNKL